MKRIVPLNLQYFAEEGQQTESGQAGTQNTSATPEIDYDKLAGIISGKQSVAEDTVLKGYFKQQGMSEDEMKQAIAAYEMKEAIGAFKKQKAENTPDVAAIQEQLAKAQTQVRRAELEKQATIQALELGLDVKTVPYAIKMAELDKAVGEDGKINTESIKSALTQVLEDIPGLKPQAQVSGGFQIGASGNGQNTQTTQEQLNAAFGV